MIYFPKPLSLDGTLIISVILFKNLYDIYPTSIPSDKLCESMLDNKKNKKKRKRKKRRYITFKEGKLPPSNDEN